MAPNAKITDFFQEKSSAQLESEYRDIVDPAILRHNEKVVEYMKTMKDLVENPSLSSCERPNACAGSTYEGLVDCCHSAGLCYFDIAQDELAVINRLIQRCKECLIEDIKMITPITLTMFPYLCYQRLINVTFIQFLNYFRNGKRECTDYLTAMFSFFEKWKSLSDTKEIKQFHKLRYNKFVSQLNYFRETSHGYLLMNYPIPSPIR